MPRVTERARRQDAGAVGLGRPAWSRRGALAAEEPMTVRYISTPSGSMDLILGSQRLRTRRALVHMSAAMTFISLSLKLGAKF